MKLRAMFAAFLLIPAVFAVSACGASAEKTPMETKPVTNTETAAVAEYKKITPAEAKERMTKNPKVIVVDVRTKAEYEDGHINGAILIPNETITDKMPAALPDKNAEILLYCRSGNRSSQAANKLIDMGYTNVYDFGAISAWQYGIVK